MSLTADNLEVLRLRIMQVMLKRNMALDKILELRSRHPTIHRESQDDNGKAYIINDDELHAIERITKNMLRELEDSSQDANYTELKITLHHNCTELEERISAVVG